MCLLGVIHQQQAFPHDLTIKGTLVRCLELALDEYSMVRFSSVEKAWAAIRCSLRIHHCEHIYFGLRTLIDDVVTTCSSYEHLGMHARIWA